MLSDTVSPMQQLGVRSRAASREIASASTAQKNEALLTAANRLVERVDDILMANTEDVARAQGNGTSATLVERLTLTESRVEAMAEGLRGVATLADPVGEVPGGWVRPNGLRIRQVRVPLGVVAIIDRKSVV